MPTITPEGAAAAAMAAVGSYEPIEQKVPEKVRVEIIKADALMMEARQEAFLHRISLLGGDRPRLTVETAKHLRGVGRAPMLFAPTPGGPSSVPKAALAQAQLKLNPSLIRLLPFWSRDFSAPYTFGNNDQGGTATTFPDQENAPIVRKVAETDSRLGLYSLQAVLGPAGWWNFPPDDTWLFGPHTMVNASIFQQILLYSIVKAPSVLAVAVDVGVRDFQGSPGYEYCHMIPGASDSFAAGWEGIIGSYTLTLSTFGGVGTTSETFLHYEANSDNNYLAYRYKPAAQVVATVPVDPAHPFVWATVTAQVDLFQAGVAGTSLAPDGSVGVNFIDPKVPPAGGKFPGVFSLLQSPLQLTGMSADLYRS
ncbi:MAG TPA: hypothetical protein VJT32_11855 [bacterium]|nr:hypothetical protein [bacterium]